MSLDTAHILLTAAQGIAAYILMIAALVNYARGRIAHAAFWMAFAAFMAVGAHP